MVFFYSKFIYSAFTSGKYATGPSNFKGYGQEEVLNYTSAEEENVYRMKAWEILFIGAEQIR